MIVLGSFLLSITLIKSAYVELSTRDIGSKTYTECLQTCQYNQERLSTKKEILDYLDESGGQLGGDKWTPVIDSQNEWVQIGGGGPWSYGMLHSEIGVKPSWGEQAGEMIQKTTFYCSDPKTTVCDPLNDGSGRCGSLFGYVRCDNSNYRYCNADNGWCGNTDSHRNAQPNLDLYDYEPTQCTPVNFGSCTQIKNFQWVGADLLFPLSAEITDIDYSNYGSSPQQAGNIGSESCEEATYQITKDKHWE
eukprot:146812_1